MLNLNIKTAALALALAVPGLAMATPSQAAPAAHLDVGTYEMAPYGDMSYDHGRRDRGRHEGWHRGRGHDRYDDRRYRNYDSRYTAYNRYPSRAYYGEPVYDNTRIWRGNDGQYYCRRSNGTTGLLIGAAGGALLGREIAGRYGDRTLGAILGAAGGAILGREIDRGGTRCR